MKDHTLSLINRKNQTQTDSNSINSDNSVFYFRHEQFEKNTKITDVCVRGEAKTLDVYVELDLLKCLIDYFAELGNEANNNTAQRLNRELLVKQSRSQLQATIEAHLRYDINIKTGDLRVLVPTNINDLASKTFVFNLGNSWFRSNFKEKELEDTKHGDNNNENVVKNNKMDTGDDDNMNNMNLTETYVLKTTGLGIGYFSTLSECKNTDDVKSGNLNNIILKPFNFESVIDISMVPNNDIVPWVKSVSKMPILHVSISPTHVESIMYLHSLIT